MITDGFAIFRFSILPSFIGFVEKYKLFGQSKGQSKKYICDISNQSSGQEKLHVLQIYLATKKKNVTIYWAKENITLHYSFHIKKCIHRRLYETSIQLSSTLNSH